MKDHIIYIVILMLGITILLPSCKYDSYVTPTVVVTTPISYDTIIQPIFNTNCAVSGCHVPGVQAPDLTPPNSYNNLYSYGLVDTSMPGSSILYLHLTASGGYSQMPPVGPISPTQIGDILAWIKQGAQNN